MKCGICLLLIAEPNDPLAIKKIPMIAQSGYDYAEISLSRIYNLPQSDLISYRSAFQTAKLPVEAFNNATPEGLSFVGDDMTEEHICTFIDKTVSLASFFGVKTITTCGPSAARVPADFNWQNVGRDRYVVFLRRFCNACAKQGITLALEPICKSEHGFINDSKDMVAIIDEVGASNLKLIVDLFHFAMENEDYRLLPEYASSGVLAHIHAATMPDRTVPVFSDIGQLCPIFSAISEAGFDGRISIEAFAPDGDAQIALGAEAVHRAFSFWHESSEPIC